MPPMDWPLKKILDLDNERLGSDSLERSPILIRTLSYEMKHTPMLRKHKAISSVLSPHQPPGTVARQIAASVTACRAGD